MEILSTASLPTAGRANAWNDLYSLRLAQVDFRPDDRTTFKAELKLGQLGPIGIARMRADRSSIGRTSQHIRFASNRIYSFLLQVRGQGSFVHCGHETTLTAGDFTLCDSAAPHSYAISDQSEVVMLRVPAHVMKGYFPTPEALCGPSPSLPPGPCPYRRRDGDQPVGANRDGTLGRAWRLRRPPSDGGHGLVLCDGVRTHRKRLPPRSSARVMLQRNAISTSGCAIRNCLPVRSPPAFACRPAIFA